MISCVDVIEDASITVQVVIDGVWIAAKCPVVVVDLVVWCWD